MKEAQRPRPRASPGRPLRAIGKESKVVEIADGVPGIPMMAEENMPPVKPPTYTPSIVDRPSIGLMPNVKGSVSTTAIVIVKPGIEPATRPQSTPIAMSMSV